MSKKPMYMKGGVAEAARKVRKNKKAWHNSRARDTMG